MHDVSREKGSCELAHTHTCAHASGICLESSVLFVSGSSKSCNIELLKSASFARLEPLPSA